MTEGGAVPAPAGYVALCAEAGCAHDRVGGGPPFALSADALNALRRLNAAVNRAIAPKMDHGDIWRANAVAGDCEDYALAKRAALAAAGWRADQALIAIGYAPDGAAHAALIARTSAGDFVLDNRFDEIVLWSRSDLTWVARQSARLPALWVDVSGD